MEGNLCIWVLLGLLEGLRLASTTCFMFGFVEGFFSLGFLESFELGCIDGSPLSWFDCILLGFRDGLLLDFFEGPSDGF